MARVASPTPSMPFVSAGPNPTRNESSRRPGPQPGGPAETNTPPPTEPEPGTEPSTPSPRRHHCEVCAREFTTVRGLGVHRRRAHPVVANERVVLPATKIRWNEEELMLMAREEAQAIREGVQFINQHLMNVVPDRTLESIKGVRRKPAYKQMVVAATQDLRAAPAAVSPRHDPPASPPAPAPPPSPQASPTPGPSSSVAGTPPPMRGSPVTSPVTPRRSLQGDNVRQSIIGLSRMIREANTHDFQADLLVDIAAAALRGTDVREDIALWFNATFPADVPPPPPPVPDARRRRGARKPEATPGRILNPSKKRMRRREYARVQESWKKDPGRTARQIIEGGPFTARHSLDDLYPYWSNLFGQPSKEYHNVNPRLPPDPELSDVWHPISCQEIEATKISLASAPGPDRITPRQWMAVPPLIRSLLYNIVMMAGGFPAGLLISRTIFIPKKKTPEVETDYRPISISSVAVRQLNKILANRLQSHGILDERQRAFIRADGVAENTAILDAVLWTSRTRLREVHIATLDVSKAFDTLSHSALIQILRSARLPDGLVGYVSRMYDSAQTVLQAGRATSGVVSVRRGVRQGDPLSPFLFCLAMDTVVKAVSQDVGYDLEGTKINALVFADDLVLLSSTKWGMRHSLRQVGTFAGELGLSLNPEKSSSYSLVPAGKAKTFKTIQEPLFELGGRVLSAVSVLDQWKYLGVEYDARGARTAEADLSEALSNITRGPLKPQQRMYIARTCLLPRLYHSLVLGNIPSRGRLRALDVQVRAAIRSWLRLPHDTAVGYFHAGVADGGLGLPHLSTLIPAMVCKRYSSLAESSFMPARAAHQSRRIQQKLNWARRTLAKAHLRSDRPTAQDRRRLWAQELYGSVDGVELRESARCPLSTQWMAGRSGGIPGRDYIQYHHVHINSLPTRIRTTRGERRTVRPTQCRAGCDARETAAHVIQGCWRTHGGRVKRHDAVNAIVTASLERRGWEAAREVHLQTPGGLRKPDILAKRADKGIIVDAQVVSGSRSLRETFDAKRAYYAEDPGVIAAASQYLGLPPGSIATTALTITWRGVWADASYRDMKTMCGLTDGDLAGVTTRVLQGSHTNWTRWNKMTELRRHQQPAGRDREGVG